MGHLYCGIVIALYSARTCHGGSTLRSSVDEKVVEN